MCLSLVGIGCFHFVRLPQGGSKLICGKLAIATVVYSLIAYQSSHYVRIIQLGPFWLYTFAALCLLCAKRLVLFSIFAGLMVLARESSVFILLPVLALGFRFHPKETLKLAGLTAVIVLASFLPFLIDNPIFYFGNIKQYSSPALVNYLNSLPDRFFGFSSMMNQAGVGNLRWPISILLIIVAVGTTTRLADRFRVELALACSFFCVTVFYLFALITWEYTYVTSFIVLSVLVLHYVRKVGVKERESTEV